MKCFTLRLVTDWKQKRTKETKKPGNSAYRLFVSFVPFCSNSLGANGARIATGSLIGMGAYLTVRPLACNDGESAMHQVWRPRRVSYIVMGGCVVFCDDLGHQPGCSKAAGLILRFG
jgi:hypothetical protein